MYDVSVDELQKAVEDMHGVSATFVEAVEVREKRAGKVVWEGAVKVFDLIDHPTAKRAYAWSVPMKGTKRRLIAVLGLPPVDS
jgi:hypothetical protein